MNLRENGRGPGSPGRLSCVQGIGWWLQERNIAQISLNLTDMDVTPMHVAYEEVEDMFYSIGTICCSTEQNGIKVA